jgi:hypothetical protein
VETHVGAPVVLEFDRLVHPLGELVEALEVRRQDALGGQHRRSGLQGDAVVQHLARVLEHGGRDLLTERRALGHEGAAGAAAQGDEMPALHQRGERLAQGRARDAQPLGQVALGREAAGGLEQPEANGRSEPLHRLLEGGGRLHGLEDSLQRRAVLRS